MGNEVLQERFELVSRTPSDIYEHLPTFVDAVAELQATKVVELGVRYGISTIAFLHALEEQGHLWSVDCSFLVPTPQGEFGEEIYLLDPQGPLGVQRHWTFILGYDDWPEVMAALPDEIDILFVDTNHTYELTHTELALYYPRVRAGGRIFLHDTAVETTGNATTPQPAYPVLTAVREFCAEKNLEWANNPECNGLGTIYC